MTWRHCRRSATASARPISRRCCAKWLAILPSPFTVEDQDAGYAYELSVLQAEMVLTEMLDAPVAGRIFFEQVLRDNLDIGREISLVFGRRLVTRGRRCYARDVPHPGHHRRGHPIPAR